jgi:hypothetical protein
MFPGLLVVGGGAGNAHAHGSWDEAEDEYDEWCGEGTRAGAHMSACSDDDDDGEGDDDDYDNDDDDDAGDEHGGGSGGGGGGGGWSSSGGGPHIEDVD